jgi:hypothetical protein
MAEIIFARSRHVYQSYSDFWQLVVLSGFPTCYVDEIDFRSKNLYITTPMNGDYRAHLDNHKDDRRCTLVHWMLERPEESVAEFVSANQELVEQNYVDINICSDPAMARDSGAGYVPMGSHDGLGTPGEGYEKFYDAACLMAYTGRRAFLFASPGTLKRDWNGLMLAPNCWGTKRDGVLRASRFALNIHKDEFRYCEPLRFAVFIAYGLPVLSEAFDLRQSLYGSSFAFFEIFSDLPHIAKILNSESLRRAALDTRKELTTSVSFRRCLEMFL